MYCIWQKGSSPPRAGRLGVLNITKEKGRLLTGKKKRQVCKGLGAFRIQNCMTNDSLRHGSFCRFPQILENYIFAYFWGRARVLASPLLMSPIYNF
jgi:hypothetical protein